MDKLKPCPFCGGEPKIVRWGSLCGVECKFDDCLVQPETILCHAIDEAIEAWNRRATDD